VEDEDIEDEMERYRGWWERSREVTRENATDEPVVRDVRSEEPSFEADVDDDEGGRFFGGGTNTVQDVSAISADDTVWMSKLADNGRLAIRPCRPSWTS
jgi:hypothetical protein